MVLCVEGQAGWILYMMGGGIESVCRISKAHVNILNQLWDNQIILLLSVAILGLVPSQDNML